LPIIDLFFCVNFKVKNFISQKPNKNDSFNTYFLRIKFADVNYNK